LKLTFETKRDGEIDDKRVSSIYPQISPITFETNFGN
jgi:hypothetical protein